MKKKLWFALLTLFPFVLIAQDIPIPETKITDANSLLLYLINTTILGLSPWLVSILWKVWPKIPKPVLPVLTPVFGSVAGYLVNLSGLEDTNAILGAAAGAGGLVLRQFVKEYKERRAAKDVTD